VKENSIAAGRQAEPIIADLMREVPQEMRKTESLASQWRARSFT